MATNTNPVLGVVIIARHGDRQGFYQSPTTYTASNTVITPLGEVQEYQLGQILRSKYLEPTSPDAIPGLNTTTAVQGQIVSTADGGGEGGVIYDSAVALWQGFYPPSNANDISTITLANGSSVTSPLGGYQYVPINAVLPTEGVNLEGWVSCNTFTARLAQVQQSAPYLAVQAQYEPFLASLNTTGLIGNRTISLDNMWNLFDFVNVQNIHNATYAALVNSSGVDLDLVRALANYHEYITFSDPSPSGIGNIAGRVFMPQVITALQGFTNSSNPAKIAHFQAAYKPFLSMFNMTNVAAATNPPFPDPQGIVDYASVVVFELRNNTAGTGHDVRFGFKNGTYDGDIQYYPLFGTESVDLDLNMFTDNLTPSLVSNLTSWCSVCSNTQDRGCDALTAAAKSGNITASGMGGGSTTSSSNSTTTTTGTTGGQVIKGDAVSPVGSGFIGAAVTLVVLLALLGVLTRLGFITLSSSSARKNRKNKTTMAEKEGSPYKSGNGSYSNGGA